MTDKEKDRKYDPDRGVVVTWDNAGNAFVTMSVNNIPLRQFDEWMKVCRKEYSGKRWDMIMSDRLKSKSYDMLMLAEQPEEMPEDKEDKNPLGLLNGGKEDE